MENQKICIIGGGLSGLITALSLSKLKITIDLVTGNIKENLTSNRTLAISQNNYDYFNKINSNIFTKNEFWPCHQIKLYNESKNNLFHEIFQIKKENKKVFYMMESSKIIKYLVKNIKKNKFISLKNNKKVNKISNLGLLKSVKIDNITSKYNLVIVCSGKKSNLIKDYFHEKSFGYSYDEVSITTTLKHSLIKNNIARQIFSDNSIFAMLPISNTKTSIVWSIKKNKAQKYLNQKQAQNKIKYYSQNFLKNIKFLKKIEQKDLSFFSRNKYFYNRVLLFGDILHSVHPLAGQGFNMTLRDLSILEKILEDKIKLGLDIGSNDILNEFSRKIKPRNFAFSVGIDFTKRFFSIKQKPLKAFRNLFLNKLNQNQTAKNFFYELGDKGLKF